MRTGAFHVHICAGDVSIVVTLLNQVDNFLFVLDVTFNTVLKECLILVLSDLELLLSEAIEQVEDRFVVDLDV